jgi:signal transduction histidine kinase
MRKDGTLISTEVSTSPVIIGSRRGAVASIRDITERVKMEKLKDAQHRELELYSSLLRHDLRNDLGVILGNVDIAKMISSEQDKEMRELISSTEAVCDRMMNLLHVLGRRAEQVERKIVEVVSKAASQAEEAETNLSIKLRYTEEAATFEVPSSRLLPMVFENLFRNAVDHAGTNPKVEVNINQVAQNIEILVSDNGPGIADSIRPRLFQKGASTRQGGGLGLYLSKEIITAIGGTIEVIDVESSKGACFKVVLPQFS